jgi:nitroimidazol reductase NimA-like FMN-containing flavoprotein (pyridoxamine 5'-phosphate oxidase superfamily)
VRRKEKEITSKDDVEALIQECFACHVAMSDEGEPYVVAMNFGYVDGAFYLHCAREGRKVDMLRRNPRVCVQMHTGDEIVTAEAACGYGTRFRSVVATGTVEFLSDAAEKRAGLNAIMTHYTGREFEFPDPSVDGIVVLRMRPDSMTGKRSG